MAYQPTRLTRANADTRRAEFLAAARGLVQEGGFAAATVAAIARRSGTSTGLVYSYFDNRESLLAEVFRHAAGHELAEVEQAVDRAGRSPTAGLSALVDTFATRALAGRQLAWSLLLEPVSPGIEEERLVFRRAYRDLGAQVIRAGVADGSFVAADPDLAAAAVVGAISEALVGSLSPLAEHADPGPSAGDVVASVRELCLRALGSAVDGERS